MRKPSPAAILALLLALSWIGFLTQGPHAQEAAIVRESQSWEHKAFKYDGAVTGSIFADEGKRGWELVAVAQGREGGFYYYLKRPKQ